MNQTTLVQAGVLFADISGSTRLYETLGDAEAQRVIKLCLEAMSRVVTEHDGEVVKTIGDEIMCRFAEAENAALAALAMQRQLHEDPPVDKVEVRMRMGFHYGPVIPLGGDIFGDAVNVAARMAAIAKPEQIITSEETVAHFEDATRALARRFDTAQIKGKRDEMVIYEVLWERRNVTQMITSPEVSAPAVAMLLHLGYQDTKLTLDATNTPCFIGRDPGCNLVVASPFASRQHVRIEYRRGKFVLIDQSTNGTYVVVSHVGATPEEIYLRREELPLMRSGVICLGESSRKGQAHAIHFDCD